jgi:glycosyltransferase
MFQDVVIVIPAYEPDDRLLELLKNIRDKENQMFDIILVDDGSGADFAPLFAIADKKMYENKSQKGKSNV